MIAANHSSSAKSFIVRRIFRIYPTYWLSILIVVSVIAVQIIITGYNSSAVLPKSPVAVLQTLMLLIEPTSGVKAINWVYWSLTYEVCFYIVMFIYLLFPKNIRFFWLLIISVLAILLPKHGNWLFFFITHWPSFLLGIAIFNLNTYKKTKIVETTLLLVLSSLGLFINTENPSIYSIVCFFVGFLLILNTFYTLPKNYFSKYGDSSYSIYLIHVPIGIYLFRMFGPIKIVQENLIIHILWDILIYIVIVVISRFIYIKFENPAIQYGKKISKSL